MDRVKLFRNLAGRYKLNVALQGFIYLFVLIEILALFQLCPWFISQGLPKKHLFSIKKISVTRRIDIPRGPLGNYGGLSFNILKNY